MDNATPVKPQRPKAEYYYLKRDLQNFERLFLVMYLRDKYKVPMTDAQAQAVPDYDGPVSSVLESKDDVVDFIWERYREDGMVGKRSLLKKAPRDPDLDTSAVTNDDDDDEEGREEQEGDKKENKDTPPEEADDVKTNTQKQRPAAHRPSARRHQYSEKRAANSSRALAKEIPIPAEQKTDSASEKEEDVVSVLTPYLDSGTRERKAIYDKIEEIASTQRQLNDALDEMKTIQNQITSFLDSSLHEVMKPNFQRLRETATQQGRLLSVLLSDLRMDQEYPGFQNEELRDSLRFLLDETPVFNTPGPRTHPRYRNNDDNHDDGKEEEQGEDNDESGDADHQNVTAKVFAVDDDFLISLDIGDRLITLEDLQDPKEVTDAQMLQIGTILGLSLRGMPRVRSVPLVWETLAAAAQPLEE